MFLIKKNKKIINKLIKFLKQFDHKIKKNL